MTPTIYEVLTEIDKSDDRETTLAQYENDSIFIKYLKIAFGVDYKFSPDLGQGYPSFVRVNRDFPEGISDTTLRNEHRGFYLYQDDKDLPAAKRLNIFGGMLGQLHYTEADLLVAMKDGKLYDMFPNVTYALASKVFPQWFPVQELTESDRLIQLVEIAKKVELHADNKIDTSGRVFSSNATSKLVTIPETILSPVEAVVSEATTEVSETIPETIVEPVKVDKRSRAYRESIGRK